MFTFTGVDKLCQDAMNLPAGVFPTPRRARQTLEFPAKQICIGVTPFSRFGRICSQLPASGFEGETAVDGGSNLMQEPRGHMRDPEGRRDLRGMAFGIASRARRTGERLAIIAPLPATAAMRVTP